MTAEIPDPRPAWMPSMISLDIQGDTVWLANLTMELEHGEMAEWAWLRPLSMGT